MNFVIEWCTSSEIPSLHLFLFWACRIILCKCLGFAELSEVSNIYLARLKTWKLSQLSKQNTANSYHFQWHPSVFFLFRLNGQFGQMYLQGRMGRAVSWNYLCVLNSKSEEESVNLTVSFTSWTHPGIKSDSYISTQIDLGHVFWHNVRKFWLAPLPPTPPTIDISQ